MLGKKKRLTDIEAGYAAALANVGNLLVQLNAAFANQVRAKHNIKGGFTLGPNNEIIESVAEQSPQGQT